MTGKEVLKEKLVPYLCGKGRANCLTSAIIYMLKELTLGQMIFSVTHFYL